MTQILKISSVNPEKTLIKKAARAIKQGELVAFPTETVYGLGADAFNTKAIKKIFKVKGRPQDNPLIVHISSENQLKPLVKEIPEKAKILIDKFWPGPLTLVFKKSKKVSKKVTAGLETVAIRMPSHKVAKSLIEKSGPIAAPSANISGRPSGTHSSHVHSDLNGKIPYIIDSGHSQTGIESTVLDLTTSPATLLRPGKITREQIETLIGRISTIQDAKKPRSPGMKYKHYSPSIPVILSKNPEQALKKYKNKKVGTIAFSKTSANKSIVIKNTKELAKRIFDLFRKLENKVEIIIVERVPEKELGAAIMNRLKKAAHKG